MVDYWIAGIVAAVIALLTFGVPLLLAEVFPWRSLWNQRRGRPTVVTDSYEGRTVLITGANGAFGSRAAKLFAHRDVKTLVLVDVRDCGELKTQIEAEFSADGKAVPEILVWTVDMMSFAGCQELGQKARGLRTLDHVLMTMGILSFNRKESPEGWETSIQVNFLSTALLSLLLIPHLKSAQANPNPPVLTFVTTFGVYPASVTMALRKDGAYLKRLSNNADGMEQAHQYGRSKALLLYFARELASRVSNSKLPKITVNSADPGSAWTPLTNPNQAKLIPRLIMNFGARDPSICATALVNGVSAGKDGHGRIMMDFDMASYPPFMERKSGRVVQQRVWDEAKAEFEVKAPEVKAVYKLLDG